MAGHRTGAPFLEIPFCPAGAVVLPKGIEGFLEQPCPYGFEVISNQFAEFGGSLDGEVTGAFQKAVARLAEDGFTAFGRELTDFIDGFKELFSNVGNPCN